MGQINLKLPDNLHSAAERYAKNFGFRNIQELAAESMREKIFEKSEFDNSFTELEIGLIDNLIEEGLNEGNLVSEEELRKVLRE